MNRASAWKKEFAELNVGPERIDALTTWVEFDIHPRFIISGDLTCLWMNQAARTMIGGCDGSADPGADQAHLLTYFDRTQLEDLIGHTADGETHSRIVATAGPGRAMVWARGIGGDLNRVFGLVMLPPVKLDFSGYFCHARLTAAEARAIAHILQGESRTGAASDSRVSKETLKTHIRNAYRKLGVRSREELFVQAWKFIAP